MEGREAHTHTPAPLPRVAHLKEQPPKRLGLTLYSVKMALRMLFSILVREREGPPVCRNELAKGLPLRVLLITPVPLASSSSFHQIHHI